MDDTRRSTARATLHGDHHEIEIPYTVHARPDTGLYNGKLGIWLFLASEVMLFGALFSTLMLLRTSAPVWPHGWDDPQRAAGDAEHVRAHRLVGHGRPGLGQPPPRQSEEGEDLPRCSRCSAASASWSSRPSSTGRSSRTTSIPSTNNFYATYYVMTGLHGLHVLGGMVVFAYLLLTADKWYAEKRDQFTNRVEVTGLYWHFVDLVWIFLFPILYLL